MAFVEKKLPADAPIAQKALGWVDSRFPLSKLWNDQWGKYQLSRLHLLSTSCEKYHGVGWFAICTPPVLRHFLLWFTYT